jgi:transposase-like protein
MVTKEELHRLYVTEQKSLREVAEAVGLCSITVARRLDSFGIPRRSMKDCKTPAMRNRISETKGVGADKRKQAVEMYRRGKSREEIHRDLGVGTTTISRWCRAAGISRTISEAKFKGGRINKKGYRESTTFGNRRVPKVLHRAIAEAILDRPLTSLEVVHHVNGCRADNRPANLWVFPTDRAHRHFHLTGEIHPDTIKLIPYCGEAA